MNSNSTEESTIGEPSYDPAHLITGSVGLGSLAGTAAAIQFGGPGALGWMWIASILAVGLAVAENALQHRRRPRNPSLDSQQILYTSAISYFSGFPGTIRVIWLGGFGLSSLLFLLFAGGFWQSQQSAVVLQELAGIPSAKSIALIGLIVLLLLATERRPWHHKLARLIPFALLGYLGILAWVIVIRAEALPGALELVIQAMWNWESGLSGGLSIVPPAALYGLSFSLLGHEAGLGTQSYLARNRHSSRKRFAPLLSGCLISGLTGLAIIGSQFPVYERVDHPSLRRTTHAPSIEHEESEGQEQNQAKASIQSATLTENASPSAATLVPYEQTHSSQFLPSDAGQLIVLPEDSPLKANMSYPMVFRSPPRGTEVGKLTPKGNGIIALGWKICRSINTVIFRDRDPLRNKISFYDRHIAVKQIRLGDPATPSSIIFVPRDERVDFKHLASKMDGPYLLTDDFHFNAIVVESKLHRNDTEKKLAIIEDPNRAESANPSLQQVISELGFRGPYFANAYPKSGEVQPPLAFVSAPGFSAPIGSKIRLNLRSPERGLAIGRLRIDGRLETPPWAFLRESTHVVYRHHNNPNLDHKVRVVGAIRNGMLRFHSVDPEIVNLEILSDQDSYQGPFLLPPSVHIPTEVRGSEQLPRSVLNLVQSTSSTNDDANTIRSLIPLHTQNSNETSSPDSVKTPKIEDLIAAGMEGPFIEHQGIGQIIGMLRNELGALVATIAGICVLLLASFALLSICQRGQSIAQELLGAGAGYGFRICLAIATCLGATMAYSGLVDTLVSIVTILLVIHVSGLFLSMWRRHPGMF